MDYDYSLNQIPPPTVVKMVDSSRESDYSEEVLQSSGVVFLNDIVVIDDQSYNVDTDIGDIFMYEDLELSDTQETACPDAIETPVHGNERPSPSGQNSSAQKKKLEHLRYNSPVMFCLLACCAIPLAILLVLLFLGLFVLACAVFVVVAILCCPVVFFWSIVDPEGFDCHRKNLEEIRQKRSPRTSGTTLNRTINVPMSFDGKQGTTEKPVHETGKVCEVVTFENSNEGISTDATMATPIDGPLGPPDEVP